MKKEKVKKEKVVAAGPGKKVSLLTPPPEFIAEREQMWDRLKAERAAWLAEQTPSPIRYIYLILGKL